MKPHPPFTPGNIEAQKRRAPGRPKKMQATIADVCSEAELTALVRKTYERALAGEPTSLLWFLNQLPRLDQSFSLPAGLPRLDSLRGCCAAMSDLSEMARTGKLSVGDTERALALINTIAYARVSVLSRAAERLDAELRAAIEQEERLEHPAMPTPPWSPGGGGVN